MDLDGGAFPSGFGYADQRPGQSACHAFSNLFMKISFIDDEGLKSSIGRMAQFPSHPDFHELA
jgi:hypothetical protein